MVKFSLIIIHLFYGFFQALYILYINDKPKKKYIKNWSRRLLNILKIHLEINQDLKKLLSRKHFLIVSNHVSWIDIFLINSIFPICFLSKGDVARWPLIGKLTKSADTIYIKRGNKKSLTTAHRACRDSSSIHAALYSRTRACAKPWQIGRAHV